MRDVTSTPAGAGPGASLLGAVIAASGAAVMGVTVSSLLDLASTSGGQEALIIWVLLSCAGLGTVLCLYLALIWALATTVQLAGPASRSGAALLSLLRVLAPQLARRLAGGAAVATATTVLTLAPGMAAQSPGSTDPVPERTTISQTAELHSTEAAPDESAPEDPAPDESAPQDPAPEAAGPGSPAQTSDRAGSEKPLPPLGWDGGSEPTEAAPTPEESRSDPGDDETVAAPAAPDDSDPGSAGSSPVQTVIVHEGDSLWSISDDLLGPDPDHPAEIAAAWPLLYETNKDEIGTDPNRLHPGQELTVPAAMTTQDMS